MKIFTIKKKKIRRNEAQDKKKKHKTNGLSVYYNLYGSGYQCVLKVVYNI